MLAAGVGCAGEDDLAALHARARAHLDQMIGGEHHVSVVLNDDERVAEVAEALKRANESSVVGRMQPDARFV